MFEDASSDLPRDPARRVVARCDEALSIAGAVQVLAARLGSAAVGGIGVSQTRSGGPAGGEDAASTSTPGETPARVGAGAADATGVDPGAVLVDLMAACSELVSAVEAVSARAAVQLDRIRRDQEAAAGVPAKRRGRGVAAEVGLARRESAHRGRSFLGLAKVLCTEMPHTMTRLATGGLTPWRATLLAKESACLDLADRRRLDRELCGDPGVLAGLGDRAVGAAAARWAAREDPASVVARRARAEADRRVTIRPAPDTMVSLTALLPVAPGVAAYRALCERADAARAAGDDRSRGQVMADALVARLTGQEEGSPPGVLVNLVMTDTALFSGGNEPGWLPGHGPVPASVARDLVTDAAHAGEQNRQQRRQQRQVGDRRPEAIDRGDGDGRDRRDGRGSGVGAFIRRLYLAPKTGALVAMDSRSRTAPDGLAEFIIARDLDSCRVPWCDAPGRHNDHVIAHAKGGPTSATNNQRDCEAHNYAKEALGWSAEPAVHETTQNHTTANESVSQEAETPRHEVITRTPSGHIYRSTAPPLPGAEPRLLRGTPGAEPQLSHGTPGAEPQLSRGTPGAEPQFPGRRRAEPSRRRRRTRKIRRPRSRARPRQDRRSRGERGLAALLESPP